MVGKVSLYIPCYNAEQWIGLVIEGVLRQTCVPDEILIIDDGCNDRTSEIAALYPIRIIRHGINKGLAAACNTGVRNSRNDLVASVSADVIPDEDWLERLVESFDNPNIALAGGKLREGVLVSGADFWRQAHMPQDWGTERLLNPRFVYGSNLMLRKKVVEEIGGYKENFRRAGEDVDISARIRAKGYNTFYEPAAKVTHVRRDTVHSVMATYWRWNWFEYDRMRFKSVLGRAVLIHLTNVLGLLRQDVRRKKYRLLWLDLVALFAMVYFDFRLFIKTMVFPQQQVISEETKG